MHPLSVVIITYNEEQNIGRCLEAVKSLADEIIVLDSYSTDQTVTIARSHGAMVYFEKFRGYIGQKNYAIQLASNNYILSLDADEVLDDQLIHSILEAKQTFSARAYQMNRCTNYCGRYIKHGLWYPDRKIRLFDRRVARWGGLNPHDRIQMKEGFSVVRLKGNILHYSFTSPEDLIWQGNRLSTIAAASMYATGRRSSIFKMLARPAWAFVNGYFLRLGFLDGIDGFTIAINTAHHVFLKYTKLYRLSRNKQTPATPPLRQLLPEKKSVASDG